MDKFTLGATSSLILGVTALAIFWVNKDKASIRDDIFGDLQVAYGFLIGFGIVSVVMGVGGLVFAFLFRR